MTSTTLDGSLSSCRQTSNTVTVNAQAAVFPDESVATHVTVVIPRGKHVPDGGVHATPTPGQLSLATGVAKVTVAHVPVAPGTIAVMFAGHAMLGG